MSQMNRRSLLKLSGASLVAATMGGSLPASAAPSFNAPLRTAAETVARWPGHQPGKILLGTSSILPLEESLALTGPIGVHRHYYRWNFTKKQHQRIRDDHANDRLPWVSFKPPGGSSKNWGAVASGKYDADIRRRAQEYASYSRPIIATFHHEPADDAPTRGSDFSRAWCRVHDVMKAETNLQNVISVPIIGDYTFNPYNKRDDPRDWATPDILSRCHFFGVDLYQNQSGRGYEDRLGSILEYLDSRGFGDLMVGLGETGCSSSFKYTTADAWWTEQWNWAAANTDKIGVISYFNSNRNPKRPNWVLWENQKKLNAFRRSLQSATATTLG